MGMKRIKLMPDEGVDWPLWDEHGPVDDPRALGLSEPLLQAVRRWFDSYVQQPDEDTDEAESEAAFESEARRLTDAIQAELGPSYDVRYVL